MMSPCIYLSSYPCFVSAFIFSIFKKRVRIGFKDVAPHSSLLNTKRKPQKVHAYGNKDVRMALNLRGSLTASKCIASMSQVYTT